MARPKTRNDLLKTQLLSESLALLDSEGPTAVTARRVASVAGTSTAAVYELFGSKAGLVRGIFYEGFAQLADRLDEIEASEDSHRDVLALFEVTRAFALEFPMLFEVMFARPFIEFEPDAADDEAAKRIYVHIVGAVAALLGTRRNAQVAIDAAHVLLALDRGLIASELGGQLGRSEASILRRRMLAFDAAITGLRVMAEAT